MTIRSIPSLYVWVKLMRDLSDDGKILILSKNQIPKDLQPAFDETIAALRFAIGTLSDEGKIAFREIIVQNNPSLVVQFDRQFGPLISKL